MGEEPNLIVAARHKLLSTFRVAKVERFRSSPADSYPLYDLRPWFRKSALTFEGPVLTKASFQKLITLSFRVLSLHYRLTFLRRKLVRGVSSTTQ